MSRYMYMYMFMSPQRRFWIYAARSVVYIVLVHFLFVVYFTIISLTYKIQSSHCRRDDPYVCALMVGLPLYGRFADSERMIKTRTGERQDYIMNQYEIIFWVRRGETYLMDLFRFMHGECWPCGIKHMERGRSRLQYIKVHRPTNNFVMLRAICFMFGYVHEIQ